MMQHVKMSFSYIRRAPFQAMAAISVLAVTFFVTSLLAVLVYSTHQILKYFETRPQVIAFIKTEAEEDEILKLQAKLEKDARLKEVAFVSKENALEIYKDATSDNPLLGELVSPSIFPASIEFTLAELGYAEEMIDELSKEQVVESVAFTANIEGEDSLDDVIGRLKTITYYLRLGGAITAGVFILTSLLVLIVVIGMRITVKRKEIESLSLIGATNWFIRFPIVLEAVNYAVIGVLVGWAGAVVSLMYATPTILSYFGELAVLPRDSMQFFMLLGLLLGVELVIGITIALLGSLGAVSRSLRVKK